MGGNAIIPIVGNSKRITKEEKKHYLSIFTYPIFLPIREIGEKEDFGDIDLLIEDNSVIKIFENISKEHNIKINGFIKNSEITSYALNDGHQIDLIQIKNRQSAFEYYNDNDKGIIIGNIFHQLGFSYGHTGLYLKLENTKLLLSINTYDILSFLNYPKKDICKILNKDFIFNSFNEMFEFCISTPYFNSNYYGDDYLNNENRTRNRKRNTWIKFKEFIKTKNLKNNFEPNKELMKLSALKFFNKEQDYIKLLLDAELNRVKKTLFDGNKISFLTGFKGKELGDFIIKFKQYMEQELNKSNENELVKYYKYNNNIHNYILDFKENLQQ